MNFTHHHSEIKTAFLKRLFLFCFVLQRKNYFSSGFVAFPLRSKVQGRLAKFGPLSYVDPTRQCSVECWSCGHHQALPR